MDQLLYCAILANDTDYVVSLILKTDIRTLCSGLTKALEYNATKAMVEILVRNGAIINISHIITAIEHSTPEVVKYLLSNYEYSINHSHSARFSIYDAAIKTKNVKMLQTISEANITIPADSYSLFMEDAAKINNNLIIQHLWQIIKRN